MLNRDRVWSVRNGRSIRALTNKWVPTTEGFQVKPREGVKINDGSLVAEWIDGDPRRWKEDAVRDILQPSDASELMLTPLPLEDRSDTLGWPHTRDGRITVQSTYHAIRNNNMTCRAGH